eukprot:TRINITY_DN20764_c0_g1_i1.p2 TRINITY_DN20764_c0_g1~~TRINITY_DN20764_c0_g1_i1.p2  ORF type:complete len:104 (-),score=10.92 TRINITY_DN20764_c0_g1_i1:22-333(-)
MWIWQILCMDLGHTADRFNKKFGRLAEAQASKVFQVPGPSGTSYVWMGNQWNSGLSENPPGPRNHDLLYWTVLAFNQDGTVKQIEYEEQITFEMNEQQVVSYV